MSAYHKAEKRPKIVVILGPTATGKSDLAVDLALRFNGEVVSADSRQVYRGLDIGTGKITLRETRGVRHHLLDVTSPRRQFTVAQYQRHAERAIAGIIRRGKLPFLCGGTGFYISTVVDNLTLPDAPPNLMLRQKLERESTASLVEALEALDPDRTALIDRHNRRRLIRAIEIAKAPIEVKPQLQKLRFDLNCILIGLSFPNDELRVRIKKRLAKRLQQGMIAEVERLHAEGLSWQRLDALGLEYRYVAQHLQGKITRKELEVVLEQKIWQYAKRQKTWFKRDERIKWFQPSEHSAIEVRVQKFLTPS